MAETKNNSNKNNFLKKIRSKYILAKVFNILLKNKFLNIMRYNKYLQNKMNLDIKGYKKIYLEVEIEIILKKHIYGKFINIIDKKNESHFHIYFNDDKKLRKTKQIYEFDKIKKIKIIINANNLSFFKLFEDCECIKKISFIKFNRRDIKDMSYMFSGCYSLEKLNFYQFNTINVEDMSYMFNGCYSLKELSLNKFNTFNVKKMNGMFYNCSSLRVLNLSNFNTINVEDMSDMFNECRSLEELDISKFKRNNSINRNDMFNGCYLLNKIKAYN